MSHHQPHLGIVVGVDGSPSSTVAVEWAARDAEMRNVPLRLVHVVAPVVAAVEGWSDIAHPPTFRGSRKTKRANSSSRLTSPPSRPPRHVAHQT